MPIPSSNVRGPRRLLARHRCGFPAPVRRRVTMWSCKRCRSPVGTANAKSCCGRQGTTISDRRSVLIAVKTNPALDAGSRPATEARANSEPPAILAALSLRGTTNALPPIADISLHRAERRSGPTRDVCADNPEKVDVRFCATIGPPRGHDTADHRLGGQADRFLNRLQEVLRPKWFVQC